MKAAGRLAVKVYWLTLTLLAFATIALSALTDSDGALIGAVIVALCLPGGQLAASLITFGYLKGARPPRLEISLARLGKITLYGFLGSLIGLVGLIITAVSTRLCR